VVKRAVKRGLGFRRSAAADVDNPALQALLV
jgi:hypothetical protein